MSAPKEDPDQYGREEVTSYWKRVHTLALEGFPDRDDELLPVVAAPGTPDWEKRYLAHFQLKAVLRTLRHTPDIGGLRGLEFGCGTGRWVRLLSALGANMTGVDISEDVIERNRKVIPEAKFRCSDITKEPPEKCTYDLVMSMTVIQHLPYDLQEEVVRVLGEALKRGGIFLMLENIHDKSRVVFPRSITGWKDLALSHGLACMYCRGYGFDVLRRFGRRLLVFAGTDLTQLSPERRALAHYQRYRKAREHRRYTYVFRPLVAASYVAEPISQLTMPSSFATHCSFVFRKLRS